MKRKTAKKLTAKETEDLAAFKHARKRIEKDGLPDYTCVIDALITDFKAGVAWARRQQCEKDRSAKRTQRAINDLRELNRKLDRGEPINATRVQIIDGKAVRNAANSSGQRLHSVIT